MSSKARWAAIYRDKQSPAIGDLIFAYVRGVHRVIAVSNSNDQDYANKRYVTYVQIADRNFNPVSRNRRSFTCDILWTTPFEAGMRSSNFVDPERIIQKVRSYL